MLGSFLLPGHVFAHESSQQLGRSPVLLTREISEFLLQRAVHAEGKGRFSHDRLLFRMRSAT